MYRPTPRALFSRLFLKNCLLQWCIAKKIGGYTLETRRQRRRGGGVLGDGVSPSPETRYPVPQPTRDSEGAS